MSVYVVCVNLANSATEPIIVNSIIGSTSSSCTSCSWTSTPTQTHGPSLPHRSLSLCLPFYWFSLCLHLRPSVSPPVRLCLFVCLSAYGLSVCLSVCLSSSVARHTDTQTCHTYTATLPPMNAHCAGGAYRRSTLPQVPWSSITAAFSMAVPSPSVPIASFHPPPVGKTSTPTPGGPE